MTTSGSMQSIWRAAQRASLFAVVSLFGCAFHATAPEREAGQGATPARTVEIIRDRYGMAHLYASREEDGFYGLGYALAEDRLQQVLVWYVAARGELAETFGAHPSALPSMDSPYDARISESPLYDAVTNDINARRYRLLELARLNFPQLPQQMQANLKRFIQGIEAYMREYPEKTPSWAPKLEPALPLALYHHQASEQVAVCDARRATERMSAAVSSGWDADTVPGLLPMGASNGWAVAGSRTADGRVIMGSDSHGGIGSAYGTTFYPYRIKAGKVDLFAFDRPGTLNFLFGHSPYFAWGLTEGPRYVADCYRVVVDAQSPKQYTYDGKLMTMESSPYEIKVKGAAPVKGTFEYTRHNDVLSPVVARDGNVAYVVSYAYADRIGLSVGQGYQIASATTRSELEQALQQRDLYPANLILGGADGTILYIRPGRVPVRPAGIDFKRTLDGNTSATAWRGIHGYSDLIKLVNPVQGYVSNSNVSPDAMYPEPVLKAGDYPAYFAFESTPQWTRQQRIVELLDASNKLTVEGAMRILHDETIQATRAWGPAIGRVLRSRLDLLADRPVELKDFLKRLAEFDGQFSKESTGAVYHAFLRQLLYENHHEEMDALQDAIDAGQVTRGQEELLVMAASEALDRINSTFGRSDITWGDIHRVGRGGVDLPVGGGNVILGVRGGRMTGNHDWPARTGVSPRAVYFAEGAQGRQRLAEGIRIPFLVHFAREGVQSYAQALWGVSDEPSSKHYADQSALASEKILRPIPLSRAALNLEAVSKKSLPIPGDLEHSIQRSP